MLSWFSAPVATILSLATVGAHPGVHPGEAFTFKFSLAGIEGGRARVSVGMPTTQRGKRLLSVHGQAETSAFVRVLAPLDDDYQVTLDTDQLLPIKVTEVEKGVRQRRFFATIDGRTADIDLTAPNRQIKRRRILPRLARDPASGLFALRALPLTDGQTLDLDILDGNALWRASLHVKRGEAIRLSTDGPEEARRPAVLVSGAARLLDDAGLPRADKPPRTISIWLSDDPSRVLLRLQADSEFGPCAVELTSYVPPTTAAARPPKLPGIETR